MRRSVVIDCSPENAHRYRSGWAIVAVDVIRATTTAVTAVANGRRCFPAPTVEAAFSLAKHLENPLVAGETSGKMPRDFDLNNSPADVAFRTDVHRPLVLVSSSGTKLIHNASGCKGLYLACFRNYSAVASYLAEHHPRVAIIGAGSRGEFREEDQICCAWIAAQLINQGYAAEDQNTATVVRRWTHAPAKACLCSHSVDYLLRTGQLADLDYILSHVDDLDAVFAVRDGEVVMVPTVDGLDAEQAATAARLGEFPATVAVEA